MVGGKDQPLLFTPEGTPVVRVGSASTEDYVPIVPYLETVNASGVTERSVISLQQRRRGVGEIFQEAVQAQERGVQPELTPVEAQTPTEEQLTFREPLVEQSETPRNTTLRTTVGGQRARLFGALGQQPENINPAPAIDAPKEVGGAGAAALKPEQLREKLTRKSTPENISANPTNLPGGNPLPSAHKSELSPDSTIAKAARGEEVETPDFSGRSFSNTTPEKPKPKSVNERLRNLPSVQPDDVVEPETSSGDAPTENDENR